MTCDSTSERYKMGGEAALKPTGLLLIVEPPIHVAMKAFAQTINKARKTGFIPAERPRIFFSKVVVLKKS